MTANELVYEVQMAEKTLLNDIASIVSQRINELSDKTGLELGTITMNFAEVTKLGDSTKKYILSDIDIDHSLPSRVHGL